MNTRLVRSALIPLIAVIAAIAAALPLFAAPGDLDPTFDTDGMFIDQIGTLDDEVWFDVAVQDDGKHVFAGYCGGPTQRQFCIVRLLDNGSFDPDFDGDSGTGNGIVGVDTGSGSSTGTGLALQDDGKIVVAGYCQGAAGLDFCVIRLLENGALDSDFGTAGKVVIAPTTDSDQAPKVAIQDDGKIVLAGECGGTNGDFCAVRLLDGGDPDPDFGAAGIAMVDIGGNDDNAKDLAIRADGTIVLAGACRNTDVSNDDFCVLRLDDSGDPDSSFDGDGKLMFSFDGNSEGAWSVAIQGDQKMVVAGACGPNSDRSFCVARLNEDGTFDDTFDGNSGTANGRIMLAMTAYQDEAMSVLVQFDGAIVLAGFCDTDSDSNTFNWQFCLALLDEAGVLDTGFSTDGKVFTSIGTGDRANAVAFVPGTPGKLVAAGFCYETTAARSCAARYETTAGDPDADNDGVDLPGDLCPSTAAGESVNEDGCSANDLKPGDCATVNLTNLIEGTSDAEVLEGSPGNDLVLGNGGADVLNGRGGDDCIVIGADAATADGGVGNDIIIGGPEGDTLRGGNGRDLIIAGDGADSIDGGNDADVLQGHGGADTIAGGNGNDSIYGGADDDILSGGNNNDILYGEQGTDRLNGGAGTDRCEALDAGGQRVLCEQIAPALP